MPISSYQSADRKGLLALWREAFPNSPALPQFEEIIETKLTVQPELLMVAVDGEKLIGSVMSGFDGYLGWVYFLAVGPGQRGRGIGSDLMAHAEKESQARGCKHVHLTVRWW